MPRFKLPHAATDHALATRVPPLAQIDILAQENEPAAVIPPDLVERFADKRMFVSGSDASTLQFRRTDDEDDAAAVRLPTR